MKGKLQQNFQSWSTKKNRNLATNSTLEWYPVKFYSNRRVQTPTCQALQCLLFKPFAVLNFTQYSLKI